MSPVSLPRLLAIIAPATSGKTTYMASATPALASDTDALYDFEALVAKLGYPSPQWSHDQWALWNELRSAEIARKLDDLRLAVAPTCPRRYYLLVHTLRDAVSLNLPVVGVVFTTEWIFLARVSRRPERDRVLARHNRDMTRDFMREYPHTPVFSSIALAIGTLEAQGRRADELGERVLLRY